MSATGLSAGWVAVALALSIAGCALPRDAGDAPQPTSTAASSAAFPSPSTTAASASASTQAERMPRATGPAPSADLGRPPEAAMARAWIEIPALGIKGLRIEPYIGTADDARGTRIQNRGMLASPRGRRGGVGPGEIGNYIVTGHRTSHTAPFRNLPELRRGEHVYVTSGGFVYDYVIDRTLTISFRDARSRASQSAPVPGRLGEPATRASITLSTCRTPEDRAEGNFWSDALGNPEHRIDKVGVLAGVRTA